MNEKQIKLILNRILKDVGQIEYVDSTEINDHEFKDHFIPMSCCVPTEQLIKLCHAADISTIVGRAECKQVQSDKTRNIRKRTQLKRKRLK